MNPYEIDITNLDRAEMIAALYNATEGMFGKPATPMTKEEAQAEIDAILSGEQGRRLYFDYLRGRCMKIHFGKDILDTRFYDRDNGQGAAAAALAQLLESLENAEQWRPEAQSQPDTSQPNSKP
jgi:hypothetical protein